jgi:hypothetical protein
MLRAIASVIVGYIAMFAFIFITFSIAFVILGVEGSYKAGVYDVSLTWIVISMILSMIAALLGGWIAALIAATATPPRVLAALVLILGLAMSIPPIFMKDPNAPTTRPADVGLMEAMQYSKPPPFVAVITPFIGGVGVLIGAGLRPRPATGQPRA